MLPSNSHLNPSQRFYLPGNPLHYPATLASLPGNSCSIQATLNTGTPCLPGNPRSHYPATNALLPGNKKKPLPHYPATPRYPATAPPPKHNSLLAYPATAPLPSKLLHYPATPLATRQLLLDHCTDTYPFGSASRSATQQPASFLIYTRQRLPIPLPTQQPCRTRAQNTQSPPAPPGLPERASYPATSGRRSAGVSYVPAALSPSRPRPLPGNQSGSRIPSASHPL